MGVSPASSGSHFAPRAHKKNGGDPVTRIAPVEAHLPMVGGLRPAQRLRSHRLRCRACNRDGGIMIPT